MKIKKFILTTLLLFIYLFTYSQSADEIITKHLKAIGGEDKLKTIKSIKMTGSGTLSEIKLTMQIQVIIGYALRGDMMFMGNLKAVKVEKGDSSWVISPAKNEPVINPSTTPTLKSGKREILYGADLIDPFYDYKARKCSVELKGREDVEGTDAFHFLIITADKDTSHEYIDATTFMRFKSVEDEMQEGKVYTNESLYTNFKTVDGIMFPFTEEDRTIVDGNGSDSNISNYDSIQLNPVIDKSIFDMPVAEKATAPSPK